MEIDRVIWSLEPDIQESEKGLESEFNYQLPVIFSIIPM